MIALENTLIFNSKFGGVHRTPSPINFYIMNIIQKTALILCTTTLLGLNCTSAISAESSNPSAPSISETIKYVEAALVEVKKSDFSAAQLLLKSARLSSTKITGDDASIKEANDSVIQGQIQAKHGEVQKSTDELEKALKLYKSL